MGHIFLQSLKILMNFNRLTTRYVYFQMNTNSKNVKIYSVLTNKLKNMHIPNQKGLHLLKKGMIFGSVFYTKKGQTVDNFLKILT
jgi:hypothetical protein